MKDKIKKAIVIMPALVTLAIPFYMKLLWTNLEWISEPTAKSLTFVLLMMGSLLLTLFAAQGQL